MCCGNDPQHQNFTSILSGPYVSAGAHSITPDIFEKTMIVYAVRRIPKATWLNHCDQFMQPNAEPSEEFINNCAIWMLFDSKNHTVAMRDVVYSGQTYQIHNHFFPFTRARLKSWKIADNDIALDLTTTTDDRFVALWLTNHELSPEAQAVLAAGSEIYRYFYENLPQLDTTKFKIATWDAGWWQIRSSLADRELAGELFAKLKSAHSALKAKILPQISAGGFIACSE